MSELMSVCVSRTFIHVSSVAEDNFVAQRRVSMPAAFRYEQPEACKATPHVQTEVDAQPALSRTHSTCSSRSTDIDTDEFQFDRQAIVSDSSEDDLSLDEDDFEASSDKDEFEEFDCQVVAVGTKSKKLTFDEHVTYIEPDANIVDFHLTKKEQRETFRAWQRNARAQIELAQQWQAYQWQLEYWHHWQECQVAQHFQGTMVAGQVYQSLTSVFDAMQREADVYDVHEHVRT
jgi:hypothetical protein